MEKHNAKVDEMNAIANKAAEEVRAITPEEDEKFKALEAQVRGLDGTIERVKETREKLTVPADPSNGDGAEGDGQSVVRAFANYIRWGTASMVLYPYSFLVSLRFCVKNCSHSPG